MKKKNAVMNFLISVGIFSVAVVLSILFQKLSVGEHVTTIFVFAVFLISRLTDGYIYGLISSICGMLAINYAFTYPYFALNFKISVNLISAVVMITVSVVTGMLTTKIKDFEMEKANNEREIMRANLLRAISHDLRTPLTTIYSASSTLRNKKNMLTERKQDIMLKNIEEDSEWLIRMVENLLFITRINNDQIKLKKTSVILDELVDSVMTKFLNRYPNQKVIIKIPEDIVVISADPLLIEQVLINLLENAVFHAIGMTYILLHVYTLGQNVVFEISDDGCGIRADKLKYIFKGAYNSRENAADSNKRNMGIGLSLCDTIIRAHGERITAENRKSGGALFRFILRKDDTGDDE